MATALAAVRLQPWQPEYNVGEVHKESFKGSFKGRVRAFGGYPNKGLGKAQQQQQNRGKICRVPLFRASSPRREALTSAMSEEHDITDMRETDKVSGEWWKPVLIAVRDWSHDKLLGLAELADGSLFFSFGPGSDSKASARPAKASSSSSSSSSSPQNPKRAAQSGGAAASRSTTHNLKALPQRYPSSFRKLSPIPASRKKASEFKIEKEASSPSATAAAAAEDKKPTKKEKAKSPSESAAQPGRPVSSFFKRSPIPKDRVLTHISKKKNQETESASTTTAVDPATDSPFSPKLKEFLDRGKESEKKSTKTTSAAGTPSKKKAAKVVVVREVETVVEVAALTSSGADSSKKKTSSVAAAAAAESELETIVDVAAAAAENGSVSQDLGSFKLPELRSLAKARGLKGYSKLKKGELVDLLAGLES